MKPYDKTLNLRFHSKNELENSRLVGDNVLDERRYHRGGFNSNKGPAKVGYSFTSFFLPRNAVKSSNLVDFSLETYNLASFTRSIVR